MLSHVCHVFTSSEVRNSSVKWVDWIDKLLPRYEPHWKWAGIYDAILLSKQSVNRDENLLATALCFWNSASNTFNFRIGPMAPTLLDMAQIFSAEKDKDQQHMLFLLYWLNRFILPNRSSAVLLEYRHLTEALHNHTDVGLGPSVLAHLFKNLHTSTLENPLNLSAPGAFWMIQIWLQVYFPELRFPDIVLPEDQVLAQPLMSAEVPKRSIEEYLMFFRHCTKRSAAQWQVVIRRTYPWFQPGYRLFEKEPEEETVRIDFRKKFLSVTLPRDMPHGGGKPPNYHMGAEVYHPNFCARQLGCPQLIPLKSYRSCNRASSWRDMDDLKVHKDARCAVNKINNSADALYPSWEPNSCSSDGWVVRTGKEAHKFMVQTIKDINAQVLEDPSLTQNVGGQSAQAGEVFATSVITAGDLELPSGEEEEEEEDQTPVEATPAPRRKMKETAQPATSELRKDFEAVDQENELEEVGEGPQEKAKTVEEEEEIPAEVIAESIALAHKQQEQQEDIGAGLTSSELALFEDPEAEQSTAVPTAGEQSKQSASEPVEVPGSTGLLAVMTSPLKPSIVAMPIHSLPGSSTTTSFADPRNSVAQFSKFIPKRKGTKGSLPLRAKITCWLLKATPATPGGGTGREMTSASRRTRMGWSPAASGCHAAVTSRRRPVLPQTFRRYFRQLRRRNPSIQIDFRVRVWPVLGSQFRQLLASVWGRSKNKSGSKSYYEPRVGSWTYDCRVFRSSELIKPPTCYQRVGSRVGTTFSSRMIPWSSRARRILQILIRITFEPRTDLA
ncbi:unnamed protein product [Prunus armeniaca]